jgi:hypothetical protein
MKFEDMNPEQREAFEKQQFKPGQSGNPSGRNGWTVLREKYREQITPDVQELTQVLVDIAKTGDVQALRLALGPIVDVRAIEVGGPDGAPINFIELARMARGENA